MFRNFGIRNKNVDTVKLENESSEPRSLVSSYYELMSSQTSNVRHIPGTWLELEWLDNWDSKVEIEFEEPHHLNAFRRQFLGTISAYVASKSPNGIFAEFGIYNGLGSKIILENSNNSNPLWLIDSFEGLSEPRQVDGDYWKKGDMSRSLDLVKNRLRNFENRTHFFEGFVPEILEKLPKEKLAFAHIDLDLFEPTLATLKFISSNSNHDVVVLSDDYGFSTCPGATRAIDSFLSEVTDFKIIPFPVGGALIFREL